MATDAEIEEFIDYSWHPSEEEFVSPLTADQWEELLGDASFAETDAAKAMRCLLDYGEPATFQQLSIRYRAAMGRYRRWLTDAARTAGERFGVGAPSKDQFGMDEWWPLLYQTRNAGKPGAGIFEMQLRPEVVEAYRRIDEAERHERRAENARQLQRIEQLERARQEERRRAAERAQAAQTVQATQTAQPASSRQAAKTTRPAKRLETAAADASPVSTVANGLHPSVEKAHPAAGAKTAATVAPAPPAVHEAQSRPASAANAVTAVAAAPHPQTPAPEAPVSVAPAAPTVAGQDAAADGTGGQDEEAASLVEALAAFLKETGDGHDILPGIPDPDTQDTDEPDYATRYATRLADAFVHMREVEPLLTEADVARELGDESVERLQDVLLGRKIPSFAYVDAIARTLFVSPRYLEAREAFRECVPIFASLAEVCGRTTAREFAARLKDLGYVAIITEDARERRTLVSCRIGHASCCLLTRASVSRARRRKEGPDLTSYRKLAAELEAYCKAHDIGFSHEEVTTDDFETLQCGMVWPGWYCG